MTLQNKINLVDRAIKNSKYNCLEKSVYDIVGLTSPRSQNFLNLISCDLNVLEIGSFCGASTVAMAKNARHVITVDNWSNVETESVDKKFNNGINNVKQVFDHNICLYSNIQSLSGDIFSSEIFYQLDYIDVDIIFYDGPHCSKDIYTFFMLYEHLLIDIILIVDDYNFLTVQEGIEIGLGAINKKPIKRWNISTFGESKETFWNGISVIIFD